MRNANDGYNNQNLRDLGLSGRVRMTLTQSVKSGSAARTAALCLLSAIKEGSDTLTKEFLLVATTDFVAEDCLAVPSQMMRSVMPSGAVPSMGSSA